jgi:PAS domain S-box-containing protein
MWAAPVARFTLTLIVLTFGTELFVMYLLPHLLPGGMGVTTSNLADAGLLSVILAGLAVPFVRRFHQRTLDADHRLQRRTDAAERTLMDLEAYQAGLDAQAILAVTDTKGTILFVNDRFTEISGYSRDELIGKNHRLLNSGTHPHAFWKEMWRTVGQGKHWHAEVCNRAKDGHLYWVDTTIVPFRAAASGEKRYVAIRHDITHVKAGAERQRELLERLKKLTSQIPGMAYQFRLRPDGTATMPYASDGIRTIYGLEPSDVEQDAAAIFSRVHPEDLARVAAGVTRSGAEQSAWRDEFRIRLPDGSEKWLKGSATFEREPDGSMLWHGFIEDVSERRNATEEIANGRARLQGVLDAATEILQGRGGGAHARARVLQPA